MRKQMLLVLASQNLAITFSFLIGDDIMGKSNSYKNYK